MIHRRDNDYPCFVVPLLNRRWKRVCTERQPAVDQLNKFNQSTSEQERQEWLADAEHADAARSDDVDAMDIYDVHSKPRMFLRLLSGRFDFI